MSFGEEKHPWTVYEGVKVVSMAPEALMAEINSAITTLEYAHATACLQSPPPIPKMKSNNGKSNRHEYDTQTANEAYKLDWHQWLVGSLMRISSPYKLPSPSAHLT